MQLRKVSVAFLFVLPLALGCSGDFDSTEYRASQIETQLDVIGDIEGDAECREALSLCQEAEMLCGTVSWGKCGSLQRRCERDVARECGPIPDMDGGSFEDDGSVLEPDGDMSEPDAAVSEPDAAVSEPDAAVSEPDSSVQEPQCGDQTCDVHESCSSCAADCGACKPSDGLHSDFGPSKGIWISRAAIAALPTSGTAWDDLRSDAQASWGTADISNQDSKHNVHTLAGALYAVRMNDTSMRGKVVSSIESAVGTESGGRTLALGRNLLSYVLAADLIGYRTAEFEQWLGDVRNKTLDGRTLVSTHEDRPNNWGTHAGASRMGVDIYLGDDQDMERAIDVFKGYLGDRAAYADFSYGALTWQSNPSAPVGVNPKGAMINGLNVDGVLPDDQRRCECSVALPFDNENYAYEAMQGVLAQAFLAAKYLSDKGQDGTQAFRWQDEAIKRAWVWLNHENDFPAAGDDQFTTFLIDRAYGTNYSSAVTNVSVGKAMGYTGWTHAP